MEHVDELLVYLHQQIDWREPHNPKYACIWKQIEACNKARALVAATEPMRLVVTLAQAARIERACTVFRAQ